MNILFSNITLTNIITHNLSKTSNRKGPHIYIWAHLNSPKT